MSNADWQTDLSLVLAEGSGNPLRTTVVRCLYWRRTEEMAESTTGLYSGQTQERLSFGSVGAKGYAEALRFQEIARKDQVGGAQGTGAMGHTTKFWMGLLMWTVMSFT